MSNGYGNHRITRERMMREYDALPPDLRHVSRNTVGPWSADTLREGARAGLAALARALRCEEEKMTYRTYGPHHPEANAHGARLRPDDHRLWATEPKARA